MDSFDLLVIALVSLLIQFYFLRSVFMVKKHIKNQETQILLLTRIAQKMGVEADKLSELIQDL